MELPTRMPTDNELSLSVVIPALNEGPNLDTLRDELLLVLEETGESFEVIMVDDGSEDETFDRIRYFAQEDPRFRGLRLGRRAGKARALGAGFARAQGRVILTLDADCQDDPSEIPRFLEAIASGADMVTGWKRRRRDPIFRVVASRFFNRFVRRITGLRLHDFNCGFKAMRREVLPHLPMVGDQHRFMPVYASHAGFKVTELEVRHRRREHGRSRYGLERYFRGLVDAVMLIPVLRFRDRPAHLFAGVAAILAVLGTLSALSGLMLYWTDRYPVRSMGLVMFGVCLALLAAQSFFCAFLFAFLGISNQSQHPAQAAAEEIGF